MRQREAWSTKSISVFCGALLGGCVHTVGPSANATGVAHYGRPRGMPIGTGPSHGELDDPDGTPPLEVTGSTGLAVPKFGVAEPPPPPCSGCVELSLYLNDINQHDEFAFDSVNEVPLLPREVVMVFDFEQHRGAEVGGDVLVDQGVIGRGGTHTLGDVTITVEGEWATVQATVMDESDFAHARRILVAVLEQLGYSVIPAVDGVKCSVRNQYYFRFLSILF